ncbi:hypothetical protein DRW07_05760 [Alteromonas sediminis]|uniref:DNA alkylation repair protein n=1 Tax=Alteromonas sediminis TaxID=2259342 RepID=A0A3N5Y1K3_9ALTE|nr:DNA alkylation repair protein [Alteromonas sediminis]RPJ67050.1 hypothetical protein DRW07_05760 [Alteromonas sediminis]
MAELFKHVFNPDMVKSVGQHLHTHCATFDVNGFEQAVCNKLEQLEFKQRSQLICEALIAHLPDDFEYTAQVLLKSLGLPLRLNASQLTTDAHGISGWAILPLADYVAFKGRGHFVLAMTLLKEMTKRCTSEFAIRPFLKDMPEQTLAILHQWAEDEDPHVRRLASEGARPRLPWGMRLQRFVEDPSDLIPLLEKLKDDDSEYVRRSVANNLNDIAKDHPDTVTAVAKNWLKGASKNRRKLVQHGCRTLVKNGHLDTLQALGYMSPEAIICTVTVSDRQLIYGGSIDVRLKITNESAAAQHVMIDYRVHHQKANGTTSAKVFKWRSIYLKGKDSITLKKKHSIRPITTRVYYPGVHKIDVQINGVVKGSTQFDLIMP